MGIFALHSLPACTWPGVPVGDGAICWSLFRELDRTQWLPRESLQQSQLHELRQLIAHCLTNVPFYRDRDLAAGIRPQMFRELADLSRLPILTRSQYQQHYEQIKATALPQGMQLLGEITTSGTTGSAIKVQLTNISELWWLACYLRDLDWANVDTRGNIAVIRFFAHNPNWAELCHGIQQQHWHASLANILQTGSAFVIEQRAEMAAQLAWLLRINPHYLLGLPPQLAHLGELLTQSQQRLTNLQQIHTIGETLDNETRSHLMRSFGVPVKNLYSCSELGYLASDCPQGHGLHVHAENVIVEVLNENDHPCQPGETGRVILTGLRQWATPFLRYEILDSATLGAQQCPCGRGLPLLTAVQGRQRPLLRLPNGKRKSPQGLLPMLAPVMWRQRQMIQKSLEHVEFRLVPRPEWNEGHEARIRRAIQEFFEAEIRVDIVLHERLDNQISGKIRDFLSEL